LIAAISGVWSKKPENPLCPWILLINVMKLRNRSDTNLSENIISFIKKIFLRAKKRLNELIF